MKRRFLAAWCVARAMVRDVCAGRFRGKRGEGEISTAAVESILAHPGEPILRETGAAGAGRRILATSHHSACVRVKRRTHAVVENSCIAVQHLTKALFLSKPVEPPLSTLRSTCASTPPRK